MSSWNYEDFLRRLEAIKSMGSLEDLFSQVPGLSSVLRDVDFQFGDLAPIETILRAMTYEERTTPSLLEGDVGLPRRERIAEAAETTVDAVDSLIWQFQSTQKALENKTPFELTQEMVKEVLPEREAWQVAPNAWKAAWEGETDEEEDEDEAEDDDDWDEGLIGDALDDVSLDEEDESEGEATGSEEDLDGGPLDEDGWDLIEAPQHDLDDLLRKVGRVGLNGLSGEEKAFLLSCSLKLREKQAER